MTATQRPTRSCARRTVLGIALGLSMVLAPAAAPAADRVVYADGLASGWHNWSWSSAVNFHAAGAFSGSATISWQITAPWGGLYLHTDPAVHTSGDTALQFALMTTRKGQRVTVAVYGEDSQPVGRARTLADFGGAPVAGRWKTYRIPLQKLGAAGQRITGVVLQDGSGKGQTTIKVDEMKLTAIEEVAAPPGPPGGDVADCLGVPVQPEVRAENGTPNSTPGRPTDPARFYGHAGWRSYYDQIDGACTGTTEEILEWAAKKWGFDQLGYPDLAKAMAVLETWWRQGFVGANGEVGILQIHPAYWPDWEPGVWSTAYAADYAMAVVRSYYDGASWLGAATRGNLRDSVAAWNCGCAHNGSGSYTWWVFNYLETRPWERPGQPPEWF